jgi:hypothetical protein
MGTIKRILCASMLSSVCAMGAVVNFNTTTDLTDNFNPSSGADFSNVASGGLNDSGWVEATTVAQVWTYKYGYTLAQSVYKASIYFQASGSGEANQDVISLGFAGTDTGEPLSGFGLRDNSVSWAIDSAGLSLVSIVGGAPTTAASGTFALQTNQWYYAELTVSYQGGDSFNVAAVCHEAESDGTLGIERYNNSTTFNNSGLSGSGNMFAYFASSGNFSSNVANGFDDFEVVPEPAVMGLIGMAGLGMLVARRFM